MGLGMMRVYGGGVLWVWGLWGSKGGLLWVWGSRGVSYGSGVSVGLWGVSPTDAPPPNLPPHMVLWVWGLWGVLWVWGLWASVGGFLWVWGL